MILLFVYILNKGINIESRPALSKDSFKALEADI
ncbi:hypothetical protein AAZX31_11G158100 [Glycine max]